MAKKDEHDEDESEEERVEREAREAAEAEHEEIEDGDPSTPEQKIRARAMGWVPESEWDDSRGRRKPAYFLTAHDYIERTNENIPILRETNRRLTEKVTGMETKLDDLGKLLSNMHRSSQTIGKREYERGKAEATQARKEAIEAGDVAAVDQADEVLRGLEEIKPEEPPKKNEREEPAPRAVVNEGVDAWVKVNSWFTRDAVLNAFVIEEHKRLLDERPGVDEADLLEDCKTAAKEKFPEKFGINTKRRAPASVGESRGGNGSRGGGKTFSDLPQEDKNAYERHRKYMEENGGVKYTKDEFLAGYNWS